MLNLDFPSGVTHLGQERNDDPEDRELLNQRWSKVLWNQNGPRFRLIWLTGWLAAGIQSPYNPRLSL